MPAESGDDAVTAFFSTVAQHVHDGKLSYVPFSAPQLDRQLRVLSNASNVALRRWVPVGSSVLDVGCGHGALLESALRDYHMTGLDVILELLQIAQRRGYDAYHGNASALPFQENQFDAVVCAEVLQHFPNPAKILGELARVCKPGGRVIISTLNKPSVARFAARMLNRALRPSTLPLPVLRRTAAEVAAATSAHDLVLREVAWVLSPTWRVTFSSTPTSMMAPLATNFIMCCEKRRG